MNICYLNHDFRENTGAGRFCLSLTQAIHESHPNIQIKVLTSEDLLSGGFLGVGLNFFKIRSVFKKYDIIHALDGWPYGVIAVAVAWGLKKKIVITAIGTGAVQPLHRLLKKSLMAWAYRRADWVVAVSNNTKREILKVIPDLKIEVINHGVDVSKFEIRNTLQSQAQGRGANAKIQDLKPYVLSVGALKKRKGFDYSIKAFAEVSRKIPELKYVVVGEGPEHAYLQLLIANYQLQDKVIFFNKISEDFLISLYHQAELFILLPQDIGKDIEGFGLVFLEAAACGLPVVSAKNTSAEDAVLDNGNGFLVLPQDYKSAGGAIYDILSDKNLRDQFSNNSINFAKSMSWRKVAENYAHHIYNQL